MNVNIKYANNKKKAGVNRLKIILSYINHNTEPIQNLKIL